MLNRRFFLIALPLGLVGCASDHDRWLHHLAFGSYDMKMHSDIRWNPKMPPVKIGKDTMPHYMDFGHGVHVPLSKAAFYTLWEGPDYWLVYGAGWDGLPYKANQRAIRAAIATMKLMLMTRTFAPERLSHKNGGWRLKYPAPENYVRGILALPGTPFPPQHDTAHSFGNITAATAAGLSFMQASAYMYTGQMVSQQTFDLAMDPFDEHKVVAICTYLIPKSYVDLAFVRKNTRLDSAAVAAKNGEDRRERPAARSAAGTTL